ncbi:unnamed protein product [Rotaria sordida]|uniref:Uncharacterized protein n=1 Tax=Rotaria sordida TaxID=392033 RepID=A0A814Q077_9BILA|nr:unnamed protein product [Rotaria sordida]
MTDYSAATHKLLLRYYKIRQKIGDDFKIKDQSGQTVFQARSKHPIFGDKFILEDINGRPLIQIRGEPFFHNNFEIFAYTSDGSKERLATINRTSVWKHNFIIQTTYGQYELKQDGLLALSYLLTKNRGQDTVATIQRHGLSLMDTFTVGIIENEQENYAFILSMIIALHCTSHD